jgi:putative toxin-antitoxin system antitoxin component (TIGR02293 family)
MRLGLRPKQNILTKRAKTRHRKVYATRGASLGLPALPVHALVERIRTGLPYKALAFLSSQSGISIREMAVAIAVPERTLARRRIAGRFSPDESERLLRVSYLFEKAIDLFEGNKEAAVAWLSTPKKALQRETPLTYARTDIGAREVENLIGRLEHGVFA